MKLRKFPYPFKGWLTISNDPDFTTIEVWKELHEFIFKELKLPWANSIFVNSYNQNLPQQVSLKKYPEIALEPTDTIHTWGDFVHAGQKGFDRTDAEEALLLLKKHSITPRVWVDHSRFTGNLFHNGGWGAIPSHTDSAGHRYRVFEYTLDLIRSAGIYYAWNGLLSDKVGQFVARKEGVDKSHFTFRMHVSYWIKFQLPKLIRSLFKKSEKDKVLQKVKLEDGNEMYTFSRFGRWNKADILGLSDIISSKNLDKLEEVNDVMIAYTHLGKTNPNHSGKNHIPDDTKKALIDVSNRYKSGCLNFSSLSTLLDYSVISNQIEISNNKIDFKSDGLRFAPLKKDDLINQSFSFTHVKDPASIEVYIDQKAVDFSMEVHENNVITLSFSR